MSREQSRKAPPIGRALRILLGLALIAYVLPAYFQAPLRVVVGSFLLMLGLTGVYSLVLIVVSRHIAPLTQYLGAIAVFGSLVALYIAGGSRSSMIGGGKGQLAAVSFLAISLVIAGVRAISGCELMAIPALFFHRRSDLACLFFSLLDKFERKLQERRRV